MDLNSTEALQLLAGQGCHVVREAQGTRFAQDTWVLKAADGNDLELELGGFAYSPVELPGAVFADLERASLLHRAGRDFDGNIIYRPTRDGLLKGLAEAA
ncbi:MAG TPA: hypothetical protein VGG10_23060 [Rhizomicrobium sp.]|jgi:hypothetical protein